MTFSFNEGKRRSEPSGLLLDCEQAFYRLWNSVKIALAAIIAVHELNFELDGQNWGFGDDEDKLTHASDAIGEMLKVTRCAAKYIVEELFWHSNVPIDKLHEITEVNKPRKYEKEGW